MSDASAYGLNSVNIALGLLILICRITVVVVARKMATKRKEETVTPSPGREASGSAIAGAGRTSGTPGFGVIMTHVLAKIQKPEPHILDVPGLGLTMADGGEELPEKPKAARSGNS